MKKWNFNIILTLIIVVFIYFLFTTSSVIKKKSTATKAIFSNSKNKVTRNNSNTIKLKEETNQTNAYWLSGYDKTTDHTPKVGLITAFREFEKLKKCISIIKDTNEGKGIYQEFLSSRKKYIKLNKPLELSFIQKKYFDLWSDSCLDMLDFEGEVYTAAHERYRKRFYQTKAKTKIEIDFAKSHELKIEIRFIQFKYKNFMNRLTNNTRLFSVIKKRANMIKRVLSGININDEIEFSPRSLNEIYLYEDQLSELNGILDGSIIIDDSYIERLSQEYENTTQKTHTFLRQNMSSEAFVGLWYLMFYNKNIELGFYDRNYYNSILIHVIKLIACSLDAPCDALSNPMISNCFNSVSANEKACGKSIEEYYLSYYFSPNQLIDVDILINYFFENYAKK